VLFLAFALRLIALQARPLWYDEAFAILYAGRSINEILYGTLAQVQGAAADVHPLFYYFTLHTWMNLFGQSVVAARMLSVLLGLGTVLSAWGLAREWFDDRVATWAAMFTAASPFLIAYSQETRMYALLGFCSVSALWAFARAARTGNWRAWTAFTICGALALYSHNLGSLTFAALGLFVIARAVRRRERAAWRLVAQTALAGGAMVLLFLPWLILVPSQFGKIQQAYWVTRPDFKSLVQTLIVFSFDFENAILPRSLIAPALFGAVLVLAATVTQCIRRWSKLDDRARFGVGLWGTLSLAPVVILFLVSQWRPVYIIRGLFPAAVFYLMLAAWAVMQMPRVARGGLLAICTALVVWTLTSYYAYQGFPRGPFAQLDAVLRKQVLPGDVIVHSNKLSFFPAHYYDRSLPQQFIRDEPGSGADTLAYPTQQALRLYATTLETATAGAQRVWLVIFRQALVEAKGVHPHVAWLGQRFVQAQTFSLGDIDVMLFTRKEP